MIDEIYLNRYGRLKNMEKDYYNVLEEIVPTLVNVMMHSPDYQVFCKCNQCRTDIIVLTLNSVPPRYVTSEETKQMVFELFNKTFMRQMVNKHIISAIYVVGKNPRHNK